MEFATSVNVGSRPTRRSSERGPVVGRKNYYGSGSAWSGELAAMLFSLFQTLCLWGINPRAWLTAYLSRCAEAGGRHPRSRSRCCRGTSRRSNGRPGRWSRSRKTARNRPPQTRRNDESKR